jgi:hypothetical protein
VHAERAHHPSASSRPRKALNSAETETARRENARIAHFFTQKFVIFIVSVVLDQLGYILRSTRLIPMLRMEDGFFSDQESSEEIIKPSGIQYKIIFIT